MSSCDCLISLEALLEFIFPKGHELRFRFSSLLGFQAFFGHIPGGRSVFFASMAILCEMENCTVGLVVSSPWQSQLLEG